MAPGKKEGSGAAFWVIIIFLAIVVAFVAWFYLKREQRPVRANPSQSSSMHQLWAAYRAC